MSEVNSMVISEITGMHKKYYILENGDIMVTLSEKSWSKVNEIKSSSGDICVLLMVELGRSEYFKKADLLNGLIRPLDRHEVKKRKNEKSVGMYKDGSLVKIFHNTNIASKEIGISQSSIYNCCNKVGYCKSAGGYVWKYE